MTGADVTDAVPRASLTIDELCAVTLGAGPRQLIDAWLGWRGDRLLPLKAEADLRDIARILPWVGLLEVLSPDHVRMRVAGTALREVYGVEMTGRNLKEISAPETWRVRSARCVELVTRPCGSRYVRHDVLPDGKQVLYETVSLPLDVDAAGSCRHAIFCIAALEQSFAVTPPSGPRLVPLPLEFDFIDIGARASHAT